jgi:aspartate-semialdehyde dehydrogenase
MVLALKPLHDEFGIKRVDVATYQATSGAGKKVWKNLWSKIEQFLILN